MQHILLPPAIRLQAMPKLKNEKGIKEQYAEKSLLLNQAQSYKLASTIKPAHLK